MQPDRHYLWRLLLFRVSLKMAQFITENGKIRNEKASGCNNGPMGLFMKAIGTKIKQTEEAS